MPERTRRWTLTAGFHPRRGWAAGLGAESRPGRDLLAAGLEVILAIGALGGGMALMLGPRGEVIPLQVSALAGSPFDSYFIPGLILFTVLGVAPLVVALLAWSGSRWSPLATLGVGVALLIWIVVEISMVGYTNSPPLQVIYLALGTVIAALGAIRIRGVRVRGIAGA